MPPKPSLISHPNFASNQLQIDSLKSTSKPSHAIPLAPPYSPKLCRFKIDSDMSTQIRVLHEHPSAMTVFVLDALQKPESILGEGGGRSLGGDDVADS